MEGIRTFLSWGRQSLNIGSVHSRLLIDLTQHCSSYWKETLPSKAGSHQSSLPNHLHTDPTASSDLLTVDDEQGRVMQFLVQGTFWRPQMLILMGFVCLGKLKRLGWSSTTLEHCEQANSVCSCWPSLSISISLSSATTDEVAAANDGAFYLLHSYRVNNRYP